VSVITFAISAFSVRNFTQTPDLKTDLIFHPSPSHLGRLQPPVMEAHSGGPPLPDFSRYAHLERVT
jgi:hypothetical protein